MELGTIFRENEYNNAIDYISQYSNLTIQEIEPDTFGRRFQIVEIPAPTREQILDTLRARREEECFLIINRGVLWYNLLTTEQQNELNVWYHEWLDITDKYVDGIDIETIIPARPSWLK